MDVPANVPSADTVISEAHSFMQDLTEYKALCEIMAENNKSPRLKTLLMNTEIKVDPVKHLVEMCIKTNLDKESYEKLNAQRSMDSSSEDSRSPMHNLEIWLDAIVSQLRQDKEEGGYLYETTVELRQYENYFYTHLSEYCGYWHYGSKPLGNPFLVSI